MNEHKCRKCGLVAHGADEIEAAFRSTSGAHACAPARRRAVCRLCEVTARTEEKRANRWRAKARGALNRHADKYADKGLIASRAEFAERFRWDVDRMARDLEHAAAHDCVYCHNAYSEMGNGPADLSFDVMDPDADPYYETNVTICCQTCNREKGQTPKRLWGPRLAFSARWRSWHDTLTAHGGYAPDTLFGDWSAAA